MSTEAHTPHGISGTQQNQSTQAQDAPRPAVGLSKGSAAAAVHWPCISCANASSLPRLSLPPMEQESSFSLGSQETDSGKLPFLLVLKTQDQKLKTSFAWPKKQILMRQAADLVGSIPNAWLGCPSQLLTPDSCWWGPREAVMAHSTGFLHYGRPGCSSWLNLWSSPSCCMHCSAKWTDGKHTCFLSPSNQ